MLYLVPIILFFTLAADADLASLQRIASPSDMSLAYRHPQRKPEAHIATTPCSECAKQLLLLRMNYEEMYVANYGKQWSEQTLSASNKDYFLPQQIGLTLGRPLCKAASRRRRASCGTRTEEIFREAPCIWILVAATWNFGSSSL